MALSHESRLPSYLSLFASLGTLVCCALPSLLVLLGLGATLASLLSAAPWLAALSRHKAWVFALSGLLIAGNFVYVYRLAPRLQARVKACPADAAEACEDAGRVSRIVLWISAALYLAGFFVAYVLGIILLRFES